MFNSKKILIHVILKDHNKSWNQYVDKDIFLKSTYLIFNNIPYKICDIFAYEITFKNDIYAAVTVKDVEVKLSNNNENIYIV